MEATIMKKTIFLSFILAWLLPFPLNAAEDGPLPPQRFDIPFETAWPTMHELLEANEIGIISENRGQGYIKTAFKEYASGLLTRSHLEKIGMDTEISEGSYEKVEYQYEIEITLVSDKQVIITVDANIRALYRNFMGEEKWVPIKTNGRREEALLNSFGKVLWGEEWEMEYTKDRRVKRKFVLPADLHERVASPERP